MRNNEFNGPSFGKGPRLPPLNDLAFQPDGKILIAKEIENHNGFTGFALSCHMGAYPDATIPTGTASIDKGRYGRTKTWWITKVESKKTVYVQYEDLMGNVSAPARDTLIYRR